MSHKLNYCLSLHRVLIFILMIAPMMVVSQQGQPFEVSKEITTGIVKDVWQPFMESYRTLDVEKFKSIHATHITRVSIDMNKIENKLEYFKNLDNFFAYLEKSKKQMDIKFSILSTATAEDKVYQTGYYCISSRGSESEAFQTMAYGFFNVLLVKEDGTWKIALDSDKHVTIDDDEFRKSGVIYELE